MDRYIRFLFGDPTAVYADLRQINPVLAGEDAGVVVFDHSEGARMLFDGNRLCDHAADNHRRTMGEGVFEGTEGCLTLMGDGRVAIRAKASMELEIVLPADSWQGVGGDCVRHLQAHVVRALRDGSPLDNTARDYLNVIRIRDAIYRPAETGTKVLL